VVSVQDAESYFDIDEFNDLYAKAKPTLYIKMSDIFSIHQLVASEIDFMCQNPDDILKQFVRELGNVKRNESELMSVSTTEINLTLNPKLAQMEGKILSRISRHLSTFANLYCRSGGRGQGTFHGDKTMHPLHYPSSNWRQPHGHHGQAAH
jgi:hypothetical protein